MALAIVTGASGGIGLCMARDLAARKYDLLLIARSAQKLEKECGLLQNDFGVKATSLPLDLTSDTAADAICKWIETSGKNPEILVNNAGYGLWGNVEISNSTDLVNMMTLNMTSLVKLCHALLPYLKRNKQSYILNVASTAAYQAVPTLTTYAATKAFVVLFSRGLRWELKGTGVSVSCVSPGATSTGFIDRAGLAALKDRAEKFSMKPEEVATIAIRGMFAKRAEIVTGVMNWISVKLTYFLPKALIEKIAASLYK